MDTEKENDESSVEYEKLTQEIYQPLHGAEVDNSLYYQV
jgi:hypothetical protein